MIKHTFIILPVITLIVGIFFLIPVNVNSQDMKKNKVSDIDGNIYKTVQIGEQIWFAENLKTARFNDSTEVPYVPENSDWTGMKTPGYSWYDHETYGFLYNWYAVETGKLCPVGWHVPTDDEWTELERYLISNAYNYDGTTKRNKIAKAMSSTTGWTKSPLEGNVGNTDYPEKINASGFSALPGGLRNYTGIYSSEAGFGGWWSSTEYLPDTAWGRGISYCFVYLSWINGDKDIGLSVRCVKDKD